MRLELPTPLIVTLALLRSGPTIWFAPYCGNGNFRGPRASTLLGSIEVSDECLSLERFRSRAEARVVIENWRRHDSAVRPHSSLAYLTPHEFKRQHQPLHDRAVFQE